MCFHRSNNQDSAYWCRLSSITDLTEHMLYYKLKIYTSEEEEEEEGVDSKGLSQSPQCPDVCRVLPFLLYLPLVSLVFVLLFLAVGQRRAGADLAVSIQPLFHHLGDQGVVAAAGALLHGGQHASLRHAAVQPFPQQLLLLLLVSHLRRGRREMHSQILVVKLLGITVTCYKHPLHNCGSLLIFF